MWHFPNLCCHPNTKVLGLRLGWPCSPKVIDKLPQIDMFYPPMDVFRSLVYTTI